MSGLSSVGRTLVSRSTIPSHSCRSTSTVTSGYCSLNVSLAMSIISSGVSGPLSQTRRVASVSAEGASSEAPAPSSVLAPSSSSDPQAASASTAASRIAATFFVFTSSSQTSGGEPPSGSSRVSCDTQLAVEHEHRGAEEDVVLPERAEPDVGVVADRRHGPVADGGERRGPERLVEHVERARQDDLTQVERADHGGQRLPQAPAGRGPGRVVAVAQAGGGDRGLEAAPAAAGTGLAVRVDHHVADLAGGEAVAQHQVAVEHHAGADTVAELDREQAAVGGPAGAEHREGDGVGVVGHMDRRVDRLADLGRQVEVVPAAVGGFEDMAGGIDDAGTADADAEQGPVGGRGQLGDEG